MCLWNMDAPGGNKVKILQNLKVLYFTQPPGACNGSELWETIRLNLVLVWLLYVHPNF